MNRATSSYRPRLDSLENRLQPGSVFAGALELSALVGGFDLPSADLLAPAGKAAEEVPLYSAPDTNETVAPLGTPVPFAEFGPSAGVRPAGLEATFDTAPGESLLARLSAVSGRLKPPSGGGHILDSCLVNGDFETGDLEGWFLGNPADRIIGVDDFNPYAGRYSAYMGTLTEEGNTLSQTCTTSATAYNIGFYLGVGGGTPNTLAVYWGDQLLLELYDADETDYEFYYFTHVPTSGPQTTLTFLNRHVPDYWNLDEVVVFEAVDWPATEVAPATPEAWR